MPLKNETHSENSFSEFCRKKKKIAAVSPEKTQGVIKRKDNYWPLISSRADILHVQFDLTDRTCCLLNLYPRYIHVIIKYCYEYRCKSLRSSLLLWKNFYEKYLYANCFLRIIIIIDVKILDWNFLLHDNFLIKDK